MAATEPGRKQISTTASLVMAIAIGVVTTYLAFTLLRFGVYALGEGETFIGLASLVVGGAFLAGVLAVVVSQARAWLRGRR